MNDIIIKIKNLTKTFDGGIIKALNGINLEVQEREFVAIIGPSGCGKSTLLNMIGGLDMPDSGEVFVAGKDLLKERDLARFRSQRVGFIFQLHNLIPTLSALENVQIPMFGSRLTKSEAKRKAYRLLEMVGLEERMESLVPQLSSGERQRLAIARALANSPQIILADEPTGNLDVQSGDRILRLLQLINKQEEVTLVLVTHSESVAKAANRIIYMLDGKIWEEL
ncbi:MAG: ABC transporter ATP-binding protein [bacterium]|nr:ABC transporter ATP-binding protein [bacterium]